MKHKVVVIGMGNSITDVIEARIALALSEKPEVIRDEPTALEVHTIHCQPMCLPKQYIPTMKEAQIEKQQSAVPMPRGYLRRGGKR